MQKVQRTLVAAAAGLCFAGGVSASVIDLFDAPALPNVQQVVDFDSNSATSVSNEFGSSPTILGGYRDLVVNNISGGIGGVPPVASSNLAVADGQLRFSNSAGVVGTALVQWDGQDAGADKSINVQGLAANLKFQEGCGAAGCDFFQALILEADLGFDYSISVYSGATNSAKLTALSQFAVPTGNTDLATYQFLWFGLADTTGSISDLQNAPIDANGNCTSAGANGGVYWCIDGLAFLMDKSGTGANFLNVSSLEFAVNNLVGTANLDLRIDSITKSVPEPGTLALVGASLLGLAGIRRRRQG